MKSQARRHGLAALLFASGLSVSHAGVITAGFTTTVVANGVAPGDAADYIFFGADPGAASSGSQPTHLTNFSVTAAPPAEYGNNPPNSPLPQYAGITAPGGSIPFVTGIAYGAASAGLTSLVTLTLGAGGPSDFTFYVLYGNTDGNGVVDTSIGVNANAGPAVTVAVTDPAGSPPTADFMSFSVTGASAGDTFTFGASSPDGSSPYIGGITVSSVPEPASLMVLGVGIAGAMAARQRRQRG